MKYTMSYEDECEALAIAIRTGPHIGLDKLDPEGDYEDALTLAIALHKILTDLGWTRPSDDKAGDSDA